MAVQQYNSLRSSRRSSDSNVIHRNFSQSWEESSAHDSSAKDGIRKEKPWPADAVSRRELILAGYESCYSASEESSPRSRRTLRSRRISNADELQGAVPSSLDGSSSLDTIYSPTHEEILYPMCTMMRHEQSMISTRGIVKAYKLPHPSSLQLPTENLGAPSPESTKNGLLQKISCKNVVVVIVDAELKPTTTALDWALTDVVKSGDEVILLGVLKHIMSPMGHKMLADVQKFSGVNEVCLEMETNRKTEAFEKKLSDTGRQKLCENKNVDLKVRIAPGIQQCLVIVRELTALQATWAIFDRKVMKDKEFYAKNLSCQVVRVKADGRSTETIRTLGAQAISATISLPRMTSDTSSSSLSTAGSVASDYTSSVESGTSGSFWSRIASFKSSSHRSSVSSRPSVSERPSPPSSTAESIPPIISCAGTAEQLDIDRSSCAMSEPPVVLPDDQSFSFASPQPTVDTINLSSKLKSFYLGQAAGDDDMSAHLPSCVVVEAYQYKQGLDAHRRILSTTTPFIAGRPRPISSNLTGRSMSQVSYVDKLSHGRETTHAPYPPNSLNSYQINSLDYCYS